MKNDIWSEEELILVLDAYLNEGANADDEDKKVSELSEKMERSKGSIALRVANFRHLNPLDDVEGMGNGGKHCERVWKKYRDQRHKLKEKAEKIRHDS